MPKSKIIFFLLFSWVFAIVAPPLVSMLNPDKKPIVTVNLNEEEQHDQGKKSPVEEKFLTGNICDFSLIAQSKKSAMGNYNPITHINIPSEILLPPPKHIG